MIHNLEFIAEQFVSDFERGASYHELMSKYKLTLQEVEILVERFFSSSVSQEVTLIDWKSQPQEKPSQLKERSQRPVKFSLLNFFRGTILYGKTGLRGFRKFIWK